MWYLLAMKVCDISFRARCAEYLCESFAPKSILSTSADRIRAEAWLSFALAIPAAFGTNSATRMGTRSAELMTAKAEHLNLRL